MTTFSLSKSTFLKGIKCHKALYYHYNHRELATEPDVAASRRFNYGHKIGELARELFPGGIDCSVEHGKYAEAVARTQEAIAKGAKVIYEAAFVHDGIYIAIDIFVKEGRGWKIYEVKSSTDPGKPVYLDDLAIQYYVASAFFTINDASMVVINNQYVRSGDIDPFGLLGVCSRLQQVKDYQEKVPALLKEFRKVLAAKKAPAVKIGGQCSDPYDCEFTDHCWSHVPDPSVYNIPRISSVKLDQLLEQGVLDLADVPPLFSLTDLQRKVVEAAITGEVKIDKNSIDRFVSDVEYPLYFLDFESIDFPIPPFDGVRPYQHIPFQYSIHVVTAPGAEADHYEFLYDGNHDPREQLITSLLQRIGSNGTVFMYSHYEKRMLNELAEHLPRLRSRIDNIINRLVDLKKPFEKMWYYSPAMKGRASIKLVLPAIAPEFSYEGMPIADGGTAGVEFEKIYLDPAHPEKEKVRQNLLQYCKMDTLAMVKVWERLGEV